MKIFNLQLEFFFICYYFPYVKLAWYFSILIMRLTEVNFLPRTTILENRLIERFSHFWGGLTFYFRFLYFKFPPIAFLYFRVFLKIIQVKLQFKSNFYQFYVYFYSKINLLVNYMYNFLVFKKLYFLMKKMLNYFLIGYYRIIWTT